MFKRLKKVCLVLGMLVLAACTPEKQGEEIVEKENTVITHELGTTEVVGKPERVVVFDYGVLDVLSHIEGVEVVGVARGGAFPAELEMYADTDKYPTVGTLFEPNYEAIYELKPDLIIISRRQAPVYKDLSEIAPTIFIQSIGETYFENLRFSVETMGTLFGNKEELLAKVDEIDARVEAIREKVEGQTAIFTLANSGSLSVYGEGSRYDHLYSKFGFTSATGDVDQATHGARVSYEFFIEKNPDHLFVLDRGAVTADGGELAAETMENEIIMSTDAYKNGNIAYLSPTPWYLIMGGLASTETIVSEVENTIK